MNKYVKYAAIGVAGYLIGFYEMKYKVTKAMLEGYVERDRESKKEPEKES